MGDSGDGLAEGHLSVPASDMEHLLPETLSGDESSEPPKYPLVYVYLASAVAAVGGILFGYDTGIISGALLQLTTKFELSCIREEMAVSAMLFGALVASIVGGWLVDLYGRRMTIIANACVFVMGAVILAVTPSYSGLIVGRLVVGFAVSLSAIAECIYISEIAPPKRRGQLVSLNELGITLGFLLAFCVNYAFISVPDGWRYMFGLSAIPATIQGIAMLFLPDSPRFLVIKGRDQQAVNTLHKLRGTGAVEYEYQSIKNTLQHHQSSSILDLCRSKDNMRYRMIIGMGVVFFQQFTGQPTVLYYAPIIFQSVGFHDNTAATLATVGLGVIKLIFTAIALMFVDKGGRRKFLLAGAIVMTVSIATLGIAMLTWHHDISDPCGFSNNIKPVELNITNLNDRNISNSLALNFLNSKGLKISSGISAASNSVPNSDQSEGADSSRAPRLPDAKGAADSESLIDIYRRMGSTAAPVVSTSLFTKWLALGALMLYIAGYAIGFGPVSWLVLSEIFPSHLKGRAVSMATILNWGANLVVSLTFLDLMRVLGTSVTFLLYAGICLISVVFVFILVPETKGRSLEQISTDLQLNRNAPTEWTSCACWPYSALRSNQQVIRVQSLSEAELVDQDSGTELSPTLDTIHNAVGSDEDRMLFDD